jgi:hypothetical protein
VEQPTLAVTERGFKPVVYARHRRAADGGAGHGRIGLTRVAASSQE